MAFAPNRIFTQAVGLYVPPVRRPVAGRVRAVAPRIRPAAHPVVIPTLAAGPTRPAAPLNAVSAPTVTFGPTVAPHIPRGVTLAPLAAPAPLIRRAMGLRAARPMPPRRGGSPAHARRVAPKKAPRGGETP